MIKLLYVPSLNIPVCYWRIESYADQIVKFSNRAMVNVEYFTDIIGVNVAWDDACVGKGKISHEIQGKLRNAFKFFDVIIFQRIQNMPALALIQELRKEYPETKIIAELDDSVGEVPPSSPHKWKEHHRWSAEHLHRSDAVICSTKYLAESIREIVKDKPVHVAPNCINGRLWRLKRSKKSHEGIRIGYVGGGAHDEDLRVIYKDMLNVLKKHKEVTLVIRYGGWKPKWFKDHPQIDFKCVGWCMDEYPQELHNMDLDLALAPLRDSEFNRCKSNLKWIEWSNLGIPLYASNVEPYRHTKGEITLIDNDGKNWERELNDFIELEKYLSVNKKSLKKECTANYNIYRESKKVLKFIESLI